ncbi:MAG: dihydroorotase, partial [Thermodesulfobacteriota bacterium]
MNLLIKKATLIPSNLHLFQTVDVLIAEGRITEIGPDIQAEGAVLIDAEGQFLVPGLVDVHVHFREPGQIEKEDLRSGSSAAAVGGFTTVVAEPNTRPPIDTPYRLCRLLEKAKTKSLINFYSKAAMTRGMKGERLTDIVKLKEAGARALSDDGNPVPSSRLMRNILIKSRENGILITPHCEESPFYREKFIRKMKSAIKNGPPYRSESQFIKRDIELAEKTGGHLHISHVSLAKSVELIANAKKRGVKVTAEVTPHHLLLTEKMAKEIGPNAKVNPPLRSEEDVSALREGLASGVI